MFSGWFCSLQIPQQLAQCLHQYLVNEWVHECMNGVSGERSGN